MTDATQAVGKVPVSVEHADILVCSGHKIYGPKGVGAMFIRERVRRSPLIAGRGTGTWLPRWNAERAGHCWDG